MINLNFAAGNLGVLDQKLSHILFLSRKNHLACYQIKINSEYIIILNNLCNGNELQFPGALSIVFNFFKKMCKGAGVLSMALSFDNEDVGCKTISVVGIVTTKDPNIMVIKCSTHNTQTSTTKDVHLRKRGCAA
jgi:hypothetical protein